MAKAARGTTPVKLVRANRPPEGMPWVWLSEEMLSSPAMRSLNAAALQTLFRLMLEHMAHGGTENGNLICTHKDITAHGVRHSSIADAIRHLEYMGLIRVKKGRFFKGERTPSRYRLTWLPTREGQSSIPATNEWKAIADKLVTAFERQKRDEAKSKRLNSIARRERKEANRGSNVVQLKVKGDASA